MSHVIRRQLHVLGAVAALAAAACGSHPASPAAPTAVTSAAVSAVASTQTAVAQASPADGQPWGPETPNFNLEVILRGDSGGFGLVKFRQPNDDALIVYLDTWVRNLKPLTTYVLQRATDGTLDGACSGVNWLTLGKGTAPQSITTDATGTGRESLFRNLSAFPTGATFDIHFRVLEEATSAVVLTSGCYQFTISE